MSAMFDVINPATYWLTVTNIALGIFTLATVLFVGFEVLHDLHHRK